MQKLDQVIQGRPFPPFLYSYVTLDLVYYVSVENLTEIYHEDHSNLSSHSSG